jgi:serine/threonine-protein kinase
MNAVIHRAPAGSAAPRGESRRWLLVLIAAMFCGYFALTVYADWNAFEPLNANFEITPSGFALRHVAPGSVCSRAGLRDGDVLTLIDGHKAQGVLAWTSAITRLTPEWSVPVTYERDGTLHEARLSFNRRSEPWWRSLQGNILILDRVIQGATLIAAIFIAFRADSVTALVGSWWLATVGVFSTSMPPGLASVWAALPVPIGLLLFIPHVSAFTVGGVLFAFCASLQAHRWRMRSVVIALAPWVPVIAWLVLFLSRVLYDPADLPLDPRFVVAIVGVNVLYVIAGLVALWLNYRNVLDVNERRRVRIVVAGTIVGTLFGAPAIASLWLGPSGGPPSMFDPPVRLQLAYTAFLVVPVSLCWAIARHQLYDVSFVVRRSLQYMLARQALLVVTPLLLVLAALEALRHDESVAIVLKTHAVLYAGLALTLIVVTGRRAAWLDALDRRFFRDRYDACQLLREVAERARRTRDFWAAARFVVDELARALHVEWAAILVSGTGEFSPCAGTIAGIEPWPATLNVLSFVSAVRRPLEIDASPKSWLRRHVSEAEIDFLVRVGARLIVPVFTRGGSLNALIVLGTKKSDEPFSAEDKNLLMGIAETLGDATATQEGPLDRADDPIETAGEDTRDPLWLAAEALVRGNALDPSSTLTIVSDDDRRRLRELEFFIEASTFGQADAQARTNRSNTPTEPMTGERPRWGSFELIECIGTGSVGTVWRSRDTLDRDVAVKLLRSDRSHRDHLLSEGKRLAKIRHANVVHVYGADEFDDVSGLWMELIVGDTLAAMLRARGPLGSQEVIAIGKTLCAALAAVHQAGLVHQDIKAQNVMRERGARAGRYVLMDLGAGMDVSDPSAPRWGTPEYAAPEILSGARATIESDIYSMGVLLFYLLTGRFPVPGDSLEAIRAAHQRSERMWLRDLRPMLPAQFVETIDRALALAPSRRFPSAGALAEALVFDES